MIRQGIAWHRTGRVPSRDPDIVVFCRAAIRLLLSSASGTGTPLGNPAELGTLVGEVLIIELDGPQPLALALLARVAEEHGLVLFDLHAHRLLTTADISTAFGAPMIPVPAQIDIREQVTRCSQRWVCAEELGVLPAGLVDCSRGLDPSLVMPIQEEYARFQQAMDLLGCLDLEELKERLDELIHATEEEPVW